MPQRFVDVWLEGTSYIPLPKAYPGEPFRLYRNRARGFFLKHAPGYPDIPNDLLVRAFLDSRFLDKMQGYPRTPQRRGLKPYAPSGLRAAQMSLAARQAAIQRAQARMGWRVTQFPAKRQRKELGYADVALAAYDLDTTGDIVLLNTVAQGAAITQRVGKKINMKSLQIRGSSVGNSAAALNDCAYLIVYDRRPTGSLPNITDILVTANSRSFNNTQNEGRFKIVYRKDFCLVGNPTTYTDSTIMNADDFINLRGLPVTYKAAGTGAIGDIEEGALYLVTVGATAAGTSAAAASLGFRLRFWDV